MAPGGLRIGTAPRRGWSGLTNVWAIPFAALIAFLLVCILLPLAMALRMSLWSAPIGAPGGSLTFQNYAAALTDARALTLLANTVQHTVFSAALATMLGLAMAWIVTSTNVPFRRAVALLPVAPILLPVLLKDTAWIMLYSPRMGLANVAMRQVFGVDAPVLDIFTMSGMIVVTACGLTPMAYLILLPALSSMNQSIPEASRVSGAGAVGTLFRIVAPSILPAVLSAVALLTLLVATSFETPILIGLPGQVKTYMAAIYQAITASGVPNYGLAAAQSTFYLVLSAALLGGYLAATRADRRYALVVGRGYKRGRSRVGVWRWALLAVVLVYFWFAFLQLLLATVFISVVPYYSPLDADPLKDLTLSGYPKAVTSSIATAVGSSLSLAIVVTVTTAVAALALVLVSLKSRLRFRRLVEATATLPVALPPMVFSVALLVTILFVPGLVVLYNSPVPLIIASVVVALPYGVRILSGATIQIGDELLEASRVSGATWLRSTAGIALPLLGVAITNTLALTFLHSFRELGAVVLLITPNLSLLPTEIFALWETGSVNAVAVLNVLSAIAPVAVLLVAVGMRRVVLTWLRERRRRIAGRSLILPEAT